MLTRYVLHTDGEDYTLKPDDLKNWDEIKISYTRSSYEGVVRKYSSEFEFTNTAREILLQRYLQNRLDTDISIDLYVIENDWTWTKVFSCPLDFSTAKFNRTTFTLNAIDNSLSAIIKARKGTKYEYVIGQDIAVDTQFFFDRIPMTETATYEFTQGTSLENGDLKAEFHSGHLPFMGVVGSEISIGRTVFYQDDQDSDRDKGFLLKAVNDVNIKLDYSCSYLCNTISPKNAFVYGQSMKCIRLSLCVREEGNITQIADLGELERYRLVKIGDYENPADLPDPLETWEKNYNDQLKYSQAMYALIDEQVWELIYIPPAVFGVPPMVWWAFTGKTEREFAIRSMSGKVEVELKKDQELLIRSSCIVETNAPNELTIDDVNATLTSSSFAFSWEGIGTPVNIEVFRPQTVLDALMSKMTEGKMNVKATISDFNPIINDTWLIAAESVRGINGARLYTSFNDFCDWMSAVFGYIYEIKDNDTPSRYRYIRDVNGGYIYNYKPTLADESLTYNGNTDTSDIFYSIPHRKFLYQDTDTGLYYSKWRNCTDYNDPITGLARTDTLFRIPSWGEGLYYIDTDTTPSTPQLYEGSEQSFDAGTQSIEFKHRSELYKTVRRRTIQDTSAVSFEVDASVIYSSIKIGYDSKQYDSINGRDEFNFNNTYTTGCTLSDKTLQLISKYRSDCYGIEFAVQKRGEDSTDTSSDEDIFFVHAVMQDYTDEETGMTSSVLLADRSIAIEGALNSKVFNAAFCPMRCVENNAGYISLMADEMTLSFASSEGNSDIVIGGIAMISDISIGERMLTNGIIEFTCADIDDISDTGEFITVESDGMTYRGYIQSVDIKYARPEEVKYKLIVKDITA